MQRKLVRILPASLTARLDPSDDPQDIIFPSTSSHTVSTNDGELDDEDATVAAERRMQAAYAEGGVVAFGKQMWLEFEREWADTSTARERTPRDSSSSVSPTDIGRASTT